METARDYVDKGYLWNSGMFMFKTDFFMAEVKHNNLLYTNKDKAAAVIGADNLIVVDEKDALLICKKGYSEKVKDVVNKLKLNNDPRADFHLST